nr:type II toxin-antitoxin system RelE/ParE family toxin [uncultured Dyadobacter sp.]
MEEANRFLLTLDTHTMEKVLYNIKLAGQTNDPRLLKKVHQHVWEFRTKCFGKEIRLLAFWDKTQSENTLVVATHGFIKKSWKIPPVEIERALRIRNSYFDRRQ